VEFEIQIDQSIASLQEVTVIGAKVRKGAAANEFAVGSNRCFNLDEVTRFAGGRNAPFYHSMRF